MGAIGAIRKIEMVIKIYLFWRFAGSLVTVETLVTVEAFVRG